MKRKIWENIFRIVMINVIAMCAMSGANALYILGGIMFTTIAIMMILIKILEKIIKNREQAKFKNP